MMKYNLGAELNLSTRDKVYMETSFQAWYHGVNGHPLVLDNNYFYGEPSIDASHQVSVHLTAIKSLYEDVMCAVRVNQELTPWFQVSSGMKQGCILPHIIFGVYK
jgi:hypothetical protein